MKYILIITLALLATACTPLSFDEVKAREEYCKGKGLSVEYLSQEFVGTDQTRIIKVLCIDDKKHRYDSEDQRKANPAIFPIN